MLFKPTLRASSYKGSLPPLLPPEFWQNFLVPGNTAEMGFNEAGCTPQVSNISNSMQWNNTY